MSSELEIQAAKATLNLAGVTGSKAITGTDPVAAPSGYYYCALQAMAATVVNAQTDVTGAVNADLKTITSIPANAIIYGKWTSIDLTSGQMIGYLSR